MHYEVCNSALFNYPASQLKNVYGRFIKSFQFIEEGSQ